MKQPVLYIMVGYPGAGKTTVAGHIHNITGAQHLWADKERIARFKKPIHKPEQSRQLYDQLNKEAEQMLVHGESVIYDTNFNFKHDRERLRDIAEKIGANYKLIWVQTPRDLAESRAVNNSEGKPTRLWGNMKQVDFTRMANHLEEPSPDENPIIIRGIDVDEQRVRIALGLI